MQPAWKASSLKARSSDFSRKQTSAIPLKRFICAAVSTIKDKGRPQSVPCKICDAFYRNNNIFDLIFIFLSPFIHSLLGDIAVMPSPWNGLRWLPIGKSVVYPWRTSVAPTRRLPRCEVPCWFWWNSNLDMGAVALFECTTPVWFQQHSFIFERFFILLIGSKKF